MNMKHFGSNLVIAGLIGLASSAAWQQNIFFASEKREAIQLRASAAVSRIGLRKLGNLSWEEMDDKASEMEIRFAVRAADGKIGLWISGVLLLVGIAGMFSANPNSQGRDA